MTDGDHRNLGAYRVDGVDHIVEAVIEVLGSILGGHKVIDQRQIAVRGIAGDARTHGFDLGLTERGIGGLDLAIDVGLSDMIQVDQGQTPDAAARQSFRRPRAHAADAHDTDVCRRQPGLSILAIEACQAAETAAVV